MVDLRGVWRRLAKFGPMRPRAEEILVEEPLPDEAEERAREERQIAEYDAWLADAQAGGIQFADGFTYAELTDPEWWKADFGSSISALSPERRAEFYAESARRNAILDAASPRYIPSRRRRDLHGLQTWPIKFYSGARIAVQFGVDKLRGVLVGLRAHPEGQALEVEVCGLRWTLLRADGSAWADALDSEFGRMVLDVWIEVVGWSGSFDPGPGKRHDLRFKGLG